MNKLDNINKYFLNRIQTIELTKKGVVIDSNNILFDTIKNKPIQEIHPFFEIVNDLFETDDEEIEFNTINLDLEVKTIISDIVIYTGNEKENPIILVFDNTQNYYLVEEITQQKNEVFITDFFKTRELLKNEEEKAFKNRFLAGITDDLKTPISSISGLLEIFQKSNLTFDQVGLLKIIQSSVTHLNRLANDVLDLAKSEIGELYVELKSFDFNDLIQNIEKLFSHKFLLHGVDFKIIKSEKIPKYLIGDRERVMQIMTNLLENAYKYTSEGEVIFEIKIDNSGPNKIGLLFEVSDTGVGFDYSIKEELYKNYKKIQHKENGVSAIGLSIVGNLIKLLNGSIKFESTLNQGSKFSVYLPFVIGINIDRKTRNTVVDVFNKINIVKKANVLIVDDNEINQLVLMKLLTNHEGFFIDVANDSKKVMDMISKDTYNIIFIDLNMSETNSFEIISSIRNSENKKIKNLPIIALTGYDSEFQRKECKLLKVKHYIVKPYVNHEPFQAIYKILKLK
jgi:two-component system, sensor histidine kinase